MKSAKEKAQSVREWNCAQRSLYATLIANVSVLVTTELIRQYQRKYGPSRGFDNIVIAGYIREEAHAWGSFTRPLHKLNQLVAGRLKRLAACGELVEDDKGWFYLREDWDARQILDCAKPNAMNTIDPHHQK